MKTDNNKFETEDINLASYLHSNQVQLLEIIPLSEFASKFIFERPDTVLLNNWLSGRLPEKLAIDSYRHLLRDAKEKQRARFGGAR